jgi:hypothetical protein
MELIGHIRDRVDLTWKLKMECLNKTTNDQR